MLPGVFWKGSSGNRSSLPTSDACIYREACPFGVYSLTVCRDSSRKHKQEAQGNVGC